MRRLALVVIGSFLLTVWAARCAFADPGFPAQAQASNLAVPGEPAQKPYAGAVVTVSCHLVYSVIMVGHDGSLHVVHLKDSTLATLLAQLSQAPADAVEQVETPCKDEVQT